MKLHILRHAKTEKISNSGRDFDRKLMEKGKSQATIMASFLEHKNWKETSLFCSSAQRTRETFDIVCKNIDFKKVCFEQNLYLSGLSDLLNFVWEQKTSIDIFILGHNDGLSHLASYFSGKEIHLKTCGYVCVEFQIYSSEEMSRDSGILIDAFRPEV